MLSLSHTYLQIVCMRIRILTQGQTNALVIPEKCFRALNNWAVHRISGKFLTHSCGLLPHWKAAFETLSRNLGIFCIVSFTLCWVQLPFFQITLFMSMENAGIDPRSALSKYYSRAGYRKEAMNPSSLLIESAPELFCTPAPCFDLWPTDGWGSPQANALDRIQAGLWASSQTFSESCHWKAT